MRKLLVLLALPLFACALKKNPVLPKNSETINRVDMAAIKESSQIYETALRDIALNYTANVDPKLLTSRAIESIIESLNDHGSLSPEAFPLPCRPQKKELGMSWGRKNGILFIRRVAAGSSAFFGGVEIGDIIFALDGKPVQLLSAYELGAAIACNPKDSFEITFVARGKFEKKTLVRGTGAFPQVAAHTVSRKIGYIYIGNLADYEIMAEALLEIAELLNGGAEKLILDLRSMRGGGIEQTRLFLSIFLGPDKIVISHKIPGNSFFKVITTKKTKITLAVPLVVLVNHETSSAGEIIAMALRDHGRAAVIGEQTLGDGTVMGVFPLTESIRLSIPYSVYYGPRGESIDQKGLEPDIRVAETNPCGNHCVKNDAIYNMGIRYLETR